MIAYIIVVLSGYVFAVNGQNDVAFLQSGLVGGHVLVRLVNANAPELIVISNERTNARILACKHHLQVAALVGRIIDGIGVEAAQYGVDTVAHYLVGVEGVDIHQIKVFVNDIQHIKILRYLEIVVFVLRKGSNTQAETYCQQHCFLHFLSFNSIVVTGKNCYVYRKVLFFLPFNSVACKDTNKYDYVVIGSVKSRI